MTNKRDTLLARKLSARNHADMRDLAEALADTQAFRAELIAAIIAKGLMIPSQFWVQLAAMLKAALEDE